MEGEGDKIPINAEQQTRNISGSVARDEQQSTASTSTTECAEQPMESNERASRDRGNKRKYDPAPCTRGDVLDVGPTKEKRTNVELLEQDHLITFRDTDHSSTTSNITETKPQVAARETEIPVTEIIDQEFQHGTAVSDKSHMYNKGGETGIRAEQETNEDVTPSDKTDFSSNNENNIVSESNNPEQPASGGTEDRNITNVVKTDGYESDHTIPERIVKDTSEPANSGQLTELLSNAQFYSEYPFQHECDSGNCFDESSGVVQDDPRHAGKVFSYLETESASVDNEIFYSHDFLGGTDEFLGELLTTENVGDDQATQVQQSLIRTEDDSNAGAGDMVAQGTNAYESENFQESTPQDEWKRDLHKMADRGCDAVSSRKRKADELQESRKTRKQNETNYTSSDDKKTFTVIFHAMLSNKFKLVDNTQIEIRGQPPVFDGWEKSGKPVTRTGRSYDKQWLLQCEVKVPLKHASRKCAYKYVLLEMNNEAVTYEYLVEFSHWSGFLNRDIVNRCLVVGENYAGENQTFNKYDGFIYPEPPTVSLQKIVSPGFLFDDRRTFFRIFFPKWSGFFADSFDSEIQPVEALLKLDCLVESISHVWTSSDSRNVDSFAVDSRKLKLWELFDEILMPKVLKNLEVLECQTEDVNAKVQAVVSSVMIAYVFTKYNVSLEFGRYEILLKCLRLPPDRDVCSEFMENLNAFDENILSSFNQMIFQFYQTSSSHKRLVLNWLSALPLLHFLRRDSEPFEDVVGRKSVDYKSWKWWGWDEAPYRNIQRHVKQSKFHELLSDLKGMFDMDRLLKRTFLLLCPVEMFSDLLKTKNFSCFELCVTMRKLLPDTKTTYSYTRNFVEGLASFFKEINQTLSAMSPEDFPKERQKETLVLLNNFVDLVYNVKQHLKINQVEVLCRLVECLITVVVLQKKGIDVQDKSAMLANESSREENGITPFEFDDIPKKMSSLLQEQRDYVDGFIDVQFRRINVEKCITSQWEQELCAWNELLSLSVPVIFYKPWHKIFMDKFRGRVHKATPLRRIELFCKSDKQECHPDIVTCLSEIAFKAVEKVVKDGRYEQDAFNHLTHSNSRIGIELLMEMLGKAWPPELKEGSKTSEKERDEILLKHLLYWPTWPGFLTFFGTSSSGKVELTNDDDCAVMTSRAESCLMSLMNSVKDGSVTVATLQLLKEHSEQYYKLGKIYQKNQSGAKDFRYDFSQRKDELDAFVKLKNQLECFIGLISKFRSVDEEIHHLREKIEQDYNNLPIRDLCVRRSRRYEVKFFNIEQTFCDMMSGIAEIKCSKIFEKLWLKYGQCLKNEVMTMEIICENLWIPIRSKLKALNEQFLSGDMLLRQIDKYLKMFRTDYDAMKNEFVLFSEFFRDNAVPKLDELKKKLDERIERVKNYKRLFDARDAANAIEALGKKMSLKGDFSAINELKEIISGNLKDNAFKSVSDELLNAGKLFERVTPKRRSCLVTFTECFELVTWLRKSIKDEQELKVFVDLAMISAGEEDMEIDRISLMHTSCLGFGSLIFGYKSTHGFNELMELCEPVWQAVDANPSIDEKLVVTQENLPWLKQIKESHGSVALTTMVQVEAINSTGIYFIADSKTRTNESKLCPENLVRLVVPKNEDKNREEKIYSLEEIKDVQSKLMLIAGKAENGKEEVDQFNEVFEGILRISHLYRQLCEVGEINYLTWKIKFQCSKNEGRRDKMLEDIEETCETMERELMQWKDTINDKRHHCYSLNHFTLKQILNLRKELANACTGQVAVDELPLQTFMLLESVNKSIDPLLLADVLRAQVPENSIKLTDDGLKDGQKYFKNDTEGDSSLEENVEEDEIDVHPPSKRRRANSVDTLTSAKESLECMSMDVNTDTYLLAALHNCGRNATEDELVAWVVSHENDDDEAVKMSYEEAKKNPQFSDLVKEVLGDPNDQTLNDQEEFSNSTTAHERNIESSNVVRMSENPYDNNKKDTYLTLEVLAAVLENLSESESVCTRRKLPAVLKEGEPNLLLVPKGEVFGCVLSLFMGDGDKPLPTDEEVIVCDENTTVEEVELLWRRAVVDERGLLFCLVNADLLDYDVSQQAVRSLETLTQGHSKYHLVVICSSENEDKSNMVASLSHLRRHFPPTSMRAIQTNLKRQLSVSDGTMVGDTEWEPAASVDAEKLSVRVVQSFRAGMGKSLIVKHLAEQVTNLTNNKKLREDLVPSLSPTIPVHGISVDCDRVTRSLLSHAVKKDVPVSRIFHLDMSQSVAKGLDNFLFQLVILRSVKDDGGNVWRRKPTDMYVIEITTDKTFKALTVQDASTDGNYNQNTRKRLATNKYSFVKFLPRTHCITPRETLDNMQRSKEGDTGFDIQKFRSEEYQRTFQYLTQFAARSSLDQFAFTYEPEAITGDSADALRIITQYCGIPDPSWAELHHFVNFLNVQLRDCEKSVFCNTAVTGDLLKGFRTFAIRLMIQMSRDFATRSLSDNNMDVEYPSLPEQDDDLAPFQMRRRWELSPHPYIFFNHDRVSMTFLGFLLNQNGDLLDPGTKEVLERELVDPTLRGQLKLQGVDFDVNYEKRDRMAHIENLCSVMGIKSSYDPDHTYELTTDNVEKILAIHTRFSCGIPVIIMGETGCGKTRLIRFMCELQAGPDGPKNLLLMKVHGGTGYAEIEKKVEDAEKLASCNEKIDVDAVLFFDEANTTDAIDLIKEIMVDRRVNGRAINPDLTRLHFIAACNPYRKHTEEMIKKLESAGLGYHVSADETKDKLGSIPLRQLVYRVHPLPESMRPLVWDFGQLTDHTEELYTAQIVRRLMESPAAGQSSCIVEVLSASQKYMREQKNECSFVSLRDVERAMKVIMWFYSNSELIEEVIREEDNGRKEDSSADSSEDENSDVAREHIEEPLGQIVRAVILGIGVCYYARLNERNAYCEYISEYFDQSCPLPGGAHRIEKEIVRCQRGFLKDIQLGQNIARNTALSENVFMMAICTELRIPLFVVGKPGSSKSLAKDVISTNMKAGNSQSELFKNLKQIHMQSYQCSPLSTPEGIVSTFRQCAKLQKDKDLKKFVSVVVLDEIGLAEDSPLMPLKTLHPLLEDGTATAEESGKTSDHHRVGFIGLSNWALDPAKMNRGIMLSRGVPSEDELRDSASGICSGNEDIKSRLERIIEKLCKGYSRLYKQQSKSKTLENAQKDEFFGLRDFYSLVKMVYGFAVRAEQGRQIGERELEQSIRRNFSGLDDLNPMEIFSRQFPKLKDFVKYPSPECLPLNLIKESLGRTEDEGESRYLLVLTENYAALRLLQSQFHQYDPVVIFGSSFPKDQQYTQICRNINRIKVCMETGRMVILLNLDSLYESLYDALNQYYVYLADQRYVDLGLGNHRVKCRVADKFKLIVVAEKDDVYNRFAIPLINRLEKHLLVMSTGLTECQLTLVKELQEWVKLFSEAKQQHLSGGSPFKPGDCFVGYHSDTAAAVIMKISNVDDQVFNEQVLSQAKSMLLQCASPDAIARLRETKLKDHADEIWTEYFENQKHGSLKEYLVHCFRDDKDNGNNSSLVQITTHSRLLSQTDSRTIASTAGFEASFTRCISLQEFHTEQQFIKTLEDFFVSLGGAEGLLLVQCDNGERNFNLIACCRYLVDDTRRRTVENFDRSVKPIHIVFIIQLPKIAGGCQHFVGFQGGKWDSVHIDELLESNEQLPHIEQLVNRPVSDLFRPVTHSINDDVEEMDVDESQNASLPSGSQEPPVENAEVDSDGEHIDQQKIKSTFLLKNCLQAAAARIYDQSGDVNRATKRIEILLTWLPEDDSQETELSAILAARIYKLLLERDERCPEDQRLWVQHEALRQGHLQETGTFRKALWQKISSIVSPMLSEVIAYCDQNQNLSLLCEGKQWKTRLWLTMINDEVITPLAYDSFISPVSGRLRERARVLSTGDRFDGKFPFSWVIKHMVDAILKEARSVPDHSGKLVSLRGVFHSSPLGNLLRPVFEDESIKNEAAMNYLNDFLHMMYKPMVEGELQLICDAVLVAGGRIHQLLCENEEFKLDIPLIHYSYSFVEARLGKFSELVHAFPNLVVELSALRDRLDVGEMILDVVALECCLQQLEPKPEDMEKSRCRWMWCNQVQRIRPIIEVMISQSSQQQTENTNSGARLHAQLLGDRSAHILQNCRAMWIRLDVVRMFIEHTCPPRQSTHPADAQNGFLLWKALGENPDFSTVQTMGAIERFLKSCSDELSRHAPEVHNNFRNRCKSFFMELVSLYCFGEQLPNPDLVRKFISYVIKDEKRTEDFTPFDGQGIDVTPVIRSYILQKLLSIKERKKEVHGHLQEYFRRASELAEQREHLIEVYVLCVQCMEDVETVKLLKAKEGGENVQILTTCSILERTLRTNRLTPSQSLNVLDINCLEDIAGIRAALDVLSTYLGDDFVDNFKRLDGFSKCLEAAKYMCNDPNRSTIQLFLLKQLVRHDPNGLGAVQERCKRKELKWIMPPQAEDQDKSPDVFIVHENYRTVREAVANAILTCNFDGLDVVIDDIHAEPPARSCYVLLALFREITTSFSHENVAEGIPNRVLRKLRYHIEKTEYLTNELQELATNMFTNFENAASQVLQLRPGQSANDRRLIEVLVHFLVVMKCLPQNQLLQQLINLAFDPASMLNAFLPTMPHDDAPEVMQATTGTWYECPNAHRYVITECGKPTQSYICPTCGAPIGGTEHNLATDNREASREDHSATGHILGRAHAQSSTLIATRKLTPQACGILRCLTHVAMLLGTDQNIQNIAAIIKPPVRDVVEFLKEHIQHDIRCIGQTNGNNNDEAVRLIHLVLVGIVNNASPQRGNIDFPGNLTNKDSRTVWEDEFMTTYLNPVLSDMTRLMKDSLGRMVRDERLGNNRLMRSLYELDDPSYESITELSPMCPAFWRYRKKITIEFMSFKFQEYSQARDKPDRCEVLAEFLNKEQHLRALQYLPDIIKLQRLLFEKFHRRLDRNEAEKYTLKEFLKQTQEQFSALVNSFKMAWKITRFCLTQDGPYSIPHEMCKREVTNSTPISMFLPAKSGLGRCALALNNFLVTLHNDFIGRCKSLLNDESSSPEIPLSNVTKAHLVAYDPDKDFLPMIFAHCDYSLKVGEGTTIDFNWKCLERQVVDRFIRGRPRLTPLVEVFVFSKGICDGEVFKILKKKIPQVELTRPVQDQILNELTQLTDVCDVLKSIHIAIGFLSSAGGNPLMSIHEYLHSGLKMTTKNGLKCGKAEQFCQLQHIISLWLLLSLERARVLTQRKQDPFDDVSDRVKSSLDRKQKFALNGGLQKLNVDHFVRELLEFILLYLKNAPEEQLHWPLSQYINAKLDEKGCDEIGGLEEHIPEDIQVQHAVEAWKVACQKSEDYHSRMQP